MARGVLVAGVLAVSAASLLYGQNPRDRHRPGAETFATGPSLDDEINLIVAGGNYGWPHVAGFPG